MSSTPSLVRRLPASAASRCLTSAGNDDAFTSKRSSTAVDTLLTFCPPGPDARTNRSSSSRSSMAIVSVIRIMQRPCRREPYHRQPRAAERRRRGRRRESDARPALRSEGVEMKAELLQPVERKHDPSALFGAQDSVELGAKQARGRARVDVPAFAAGVARDGRYDL